jgi:hypothetical protein
VKAICSCIERNHNFTRIVAKNRRGRRQGWVQVRRATALQRKLAGSVYAAKQQRLNLLQRIQKD